jgi:DNA-directed RNA polymerase subunit RPC12/RpoP
MFNFFRKKEQKQPEVYEEITPVKEPEPKKAPEPPKKAKKGYACARCGYEFAVEEGKFEEIKCPWCGRTVPKNQ